MTADAPPRIRPGLVWAIFLTQVFGAAIFVAFQVLRAMPWLPINMALEGQIGRFTPLDWGMQWTVMALGTVAATLLWLLRRGALWFYIASTVLGSADYVRLLLTRGVAEPFTRLGDLGIILLCLLLLMSLGVSAGILAYVVTLYRRGVLS